MRNKGEPEGTGGPWRPGRDVGVARAAWLRGGGARGCGGDKGVRAHAWSGAGSSGLSTSSCWPCPLAVRASSASFLPSHPSLHPRSLLSTPPPSSSHSPSPQQQRWLIKGRIWDQEGVVGVVWARVLDPVNLSKGGGWGESTCTHTWCGAHGLQYRGWGVGEGTRAGAEHCHYGTNVGI